MVYAGSGEGFSDLFFQVFFGFLLCVFLGVLFGVFLGVLFGVLFGVLSGVLIGVLCRVFFVVLFGGKARLDGVESVCCRVARFAARRCGR